MILLKYYELELDGEPLLQYAFNSGRATRGGLDHLQVYYN